MATPTDQTAPTTTEQEEAPTHIRWIQAGPSCDGDSIALTAHPEQGPWHLEASHRTPVAVWHEMMEGFLPGSGWLRLRRETIDELTKFRAGRALPTWDDTLVSWLDTARERQR